MKKTRTDSIIDSLPQNQREALEFWLFEEDPKLSYKEAQARLLQDFNVRCSVSVVGSWWQRRAQERQFELIIDSSKEEQAVSDKLRESKAFEALAGLVGQAAFKKKMAGEELSIESLNDLMQIAALGLKTKTDAKKIEQKDRDIAISERRVKVLEANMQKAADEVKKLREKGSDISAIERDAILDKVDEVLGVKK